MAHWISPRGALTVAVGLLSVFCSVAYASPVPSAEDDEVEDAAQAKATSFTHAFIAGMAMMIVSELGDKTFFIAALMSMRHARLTIFAATMFSLGIMTVLSAYLGALATLIPRVYTNYIASGLFLFFGLRLLREGYNMTDDEGAEELEEVTQELKAKEEAIARKEAEARSFISPVFVQTAIIMFLAEWGDRSQIATIVLGAREDTLGVVIGAILGHSVCTFIAVIGGRLLAQRISVRTVTICGGFVFLFFALTGLFMDDSEDGEDLADKIQNVFAGAATPADDVAE